MVRPKAPGDRLRKNFGIRLTNLERAFIGAAAEQLGERVTQFVRRAALDRATRLIRTGACAPDDDADAEQDQEASDVD